jgi:protein-S-isoprenylcysteine O-methyltransferase Ste14
MTDQGEVYAQFVAGELEHERKRREVLDARANGTIVTSAAFVGLAVAVGIFDPASLSKQAALLRGGFVLGSVLVMVSAIVALWAGWLHGYKVLDEEDVRRLVTDPDWGDTSVDARGKVAQFNATTLDTLRSGNNKKSKKLLISHGFQLGGLLLFLAVAVAAMLRSVA